MYSRRKRRRRIVLLFFVVLLFIAAYYLLFGDRNDSDKSSNNMNEADIVSPPIAPDPIVPIEPTYKIVIDPGHGGKDGGAIGASGQLEKDFTLQLSLLVKELLKDEVEIEVHMTREDDTFISSIDRERAQIANELDADLFISIHGNTFTDPSVSGTETFYNDDSSYLLAVTMHRAVAEATGFRDRGTKSEDYFVLKETNMPAVLIEVGYLTNAEEEQIMWEDQFQKKVAEAIVAGMKEYLERDSNPIADEPDNLIDDLGTR